jgi:hypothetical protein
MLKNKKEREEFILNKDNWCLLENIDSIGMRIMKLKLDDIVSLVKFQRKVPKEEVARYMFSKLDEGNFVDTELGARYFKLVNGAINPYQGMSLNQAVDYLKDIKEDK